MKRIGLVARSCSFVGESRHRLNVWLLVAASWLCGQAGTAKAVLPMAPAVTREQIAKAWREREARVRSGRWVWNEEISETSEFAKNRRRQGPEGEVKGAPIGGYTTKRRATLVFDDDRIRYGFEGPVPNSATGKLEPWARTSAFDGKEFMVLDSPLTSRPFHQGILNGASEDLRVAYVRPILWTYRAMDPRMALLGCKDLILTERVGVVNLRDCLLLTDRKAGTFWVDPDRGFVILRYMRSKDDIPIFQIDIDYSADGAAGLVPTSWEIITSSNAGPTSLTKARVTSYEINPRVQPSEFRLTFPVGTHVVDERPETTRRYIVDRDGDLKAAPRDVGGDDQIVKQPDLSGQSRRRFSTVEWSLLIINGILFLIVLGALLRRYRVHRSKEG